MKQAGAEMCQAHFKLWFGLVRFGLVRFGLALYGLVGLGWVWLGMVWYTCKAKLNFQVSLLALDGWGGGSKLRLSPACAELGNLIIN